MRDEDLDKVIQDAASQHHPPYDDKAWEKMEELLDQHLPQKKDRKRPFFFLLYFLLLGSAVFFTLKHFTNKGEQAIAGSNDKHNNSTTEQNKNIGAGEPGKPGTGSNGQPVITPGTSGDITTSAVAEEGSSTLPASTNNNSNSSLIKSRNNGTANTSLPGNTKRRVQSKNGGSIAASPSTENGFTNTKRNTRTQKGRLNVKMKKPAVGYDADKNTIVKEAISSIADKATAASSTGEKTITDNNTANAETKTKVTGTVITPESATQKTDSAKTSDEVKEKTTDKKNTTAGTEKGKNKKKNSFGNNFAITVSAGADISYIKISNAGKLKPILGAGLSYNFGKHLTVSSGFYVSKKIYSALPEEYHSTNYVYPYLVNIDGDCKIYEIPLNIYYNFKQVRNHNWLAGAGLSTLLMKKESYDYNYKYPGGQTYQHNYTVNNENNHYLSVLTLSAGYRYKLSKRFAFIAEPYMKIPLGGVGAGKIKLNSAGVLVTAAVYPFVKKK